MIYEILFMSNTHTQNSYEWARSVARGGVDGGGGGGGTVFWSLGDLFKTSKNHSFWLNYPKWAEVICLSDKRCHQFMRWGFRFSFFSCCCCCNVSSPTFNQQDLKEFGEWLTGWPKVTLAQCDGFFCIFRHVIEPVFILLYFGYVFRSCFDCVVCVVMVKGVY